MTRICDIPILERPIERLLHEGKEKLGNEELLAILLNTGTKNASSKSLSNEILSKVNSIQDLRNITLEELTMIKGIGYKKASTLLAAIELGNRIYRETPSILYKKIYNAIDVYHYFYGICNNLNQEHFYCLYLDVKKRVIANKLLFIGTMNYSLVHPREVFREAYMHHAISIICVHNHPSGDATPSTADMELTKRLIDAGSLLGIGVDDHVIVGDGKYYSFFEDGKM